MQHSRYMHSLGYVCMSKYRMGLADRPDAENEGIELNNRQLTRMKRISFMMHRCIAVDIDMMNIPVMWVAVFESEKEESK